MHDLLDTLLHRNIHDLLATGSQNSNVGHNKGFKDHPLKGLDSITRITHNPCPIPQQSGPILPAGYLDVEVVGAFLLDHLRHMNHLLLAHGLGSYDVVRRAGFRADTSHQDVCHSHAPFCTGCATKLTTQVVPELLEL